MYYMHVSRRHGKRSKCCVVLPTLILHHARVWGRTRNKRRVWGRLGGLPVSGCIDRLRSTSTHRRVQLHVAGRIARHDASSRIEQH